MGEEKTHGARGRKDEQVGDDAVTMLEFRGEHAAIAGEMGTGACIAELTMTGELVLYTNPMSRGRIARRAGGDE